MPNSGKKKTNDKAFISGNGLRPLSKYGYDDFMKLALNSFKGKKYARAIDNCRLAVENALRQNKFPWAAEAYDLWINALIEDKRYSEIKKICCEARSKLGNYLDLLYYEFATARFMKDITLARKFAEEYREILKRPKDDKLSFGMKTINKEPEIQELIALVDKQMNENNVEISTGKSDEQQI
jgi:hypothetical protein